MSVLLEELEKEMKEAGVDAEGEILPKAEVKEEPEEKETTEEKPTEKPEEKSEEKPKAEEPEDKALTPQEQAYHRRKARELEAENKRLREALQKEKPAEPAPEKVEKPTEKETLEQWRARNPEPDKEKDLAGWLVWNAEDQRKWRDEQAVTQEKTKQQQRVEGLIREAHNEIAEIETAYKKTNPDYDNAMSHAKDAYSKALKVLNPGISDAQIKQEMQKVVLQTALQCNKAGTNLGEVLYDMAIERFGYAPKTEEAPEPAKTSNLRVVASNRKKSASSLDGGGEGAKPRITVEQAADMSPQELMGLDASDWEYLNAQGFN